MRESGGLPPGSRAPLPIMTRRPYSPLGVILALLLAVVVFALLPVPEGPLAYLVVIGGAVVLALGAADVLCYVGDLAPVLEGAARSLRELGLFAFTVERGEGDNFALLPSGRFMHGRGYVVREAAAAGFEVLESTEAVLRHEGRFAVIGEIHVLQRPAP